MPERLTDSLVRLGKLDASSAHEALHRQVMSGGALDTALLELELVSEADLRAGLTEAYGLDCADTARALGAEDPRAMRAFPEAWAKKHMLAPLRMSGSGERLELLSPAPVDGALLGRLGELLELQLVPVAAPEFRVWQRLARLYDVEPPERFRDLIRDRGVEDSEPPLEVPEPASEPPRAPEPEAAAEGPLGFSEAVSHLRDARDRDDIVRTALRYAMRDLELVAMFINHEDHLEGWLGRGPGADRVPHLKVELTPDSAFRVVLDTQAHYLGPLPADEAHQAFLEAIGRPRPHSVIVVPVRIRSRTVALLYGENGADTIPPRLAADLMLFTTHLQMSLEALLMRRKAETLSELRAPIAPPPAEETTDQAPAALAPQTPPAIEPLEAAPDTDADAIPVAAEAPEVTAPEAAAEPEVAEPEAAEPETPEDLEVAEPEVAEPEVAEPQAAAEPETPEAPEAPEITEPEAAEPEAAEPEPEAAAAPEAPEAPTDPEGAEVLSAETVEVVEADTPRDATLPLAAVTPPPAEEATEQAAPRRTSAAFQALEEMLAEAAEELPPEPDAQTAQAAEAPEAPTDEPIPLLDAVDAPLGTVDLPEESIDLPEEALAALEDDEPITLSDTPRAALGRSSSWVQGLPPDDSIPPEPAGAADEASTDEHPLIDDDGWSDVDASSLGSEFEQSVEEVQDNLRQDLPPDPVEEDVGLDRAAIAESDDGDALLQELDELSSSLEEALAVSERASAADPLAAIEDELANEPIEDDPPALEEPVDATALGQAVGLAERPEEGWDEVDVGDWDTPAQTFVGASPSEAPDPTLPAGPPVPLEAPAAPGSNGHAAARVAEDETLPDLSAEAWIRASSEVTRARPLPAEVMEAAARPAEPDPVPLTRITIGRREVDPAPAELHEVHANPERDHRFDEPEPLIADDELPLPLELPDDEGAEEPVPLTETTGRAEDSHPGFEEEPVPLTQRTGSIRPMPPPTEPVDHAAVEAAHELAVLVAALEDPDPNRRATAADALASRGPEVLPHLAEHFPGRTQLDPFTTDAELPPFAKCGALLSVLERLGRDAHPYVVPYLDAASPHHRFFAIYFYAAVFVPEAIPRLTQRLHDEEPRNCMLAARTLFSYREHPDFEGVMQHLHGRLTGGSIVARRHACYLLGLFRDVTAIPLLIEALEKKDKAMAEVLDDALAEITKQRFGGSPKKWRAWWTKNRGRSRLAWLVDGLASKDEELRRSAAEELRAVTGLDMGFDETAPKRQREEARQRWVQWWRDQER